MIDEFRLTQNFLIYEEMTVKYIADFVDLVC